MSAVSRNVLVTGGAGYIGSHTAKALHQAGFLPITYDNLVAGHRDMVRWESDVRHVFSSSCATYCEPEQTPISEDTPQHPVSPYDESKPMVERSLHWFGAAHGLTSAASRYFNAAGADPEADRVL